MPQSTTVYGTFIGHKEPEDHARHTRVLHPATKVSMSQPMPTHGSTAVGRGVPWYGCDGTCQNDTVQQARTTTTGTRAHHNCVNSNSTHRQSQKRPCDCHMAVLTMPTRRITRTKLPPWHKATPVAYASNPATSVSRRLMEFAKSSSFKIHD